MSSAPYPPLSRLSRRHEGYPKLVEWPAKIHSLFIEFFNTIFLQGQFFIAKGKVVHVIKHCIATWAACDVVSVMLIISL